MADLGSYHRLCQQAARHLAPLRNILSGLRGLLDLDTLIGPYEMRLGESGSITVDTVHPQASEQGLLDVEDVIVLAGRDYTRIAAAVWPRDPTPLAGSRGIGDQQQRLAYTATEGVPAVVVRAGRAAGCARCARPMAVMPVGQVIVGDTGWRSWLGVTDYLTEFVSCQ